MSMISELVKEMRNEAQEVRLCSNECESAELLDRAADTIEMLSEKVREPKRGDWKRRLVDNGFNADWVCSECGYRVKTDFVDYNYCPNCGADMRERDGE